MTQTTLPSELDLIDDIYEAQFDYGNSALWAFNEKWHDDSLRVVITKLIKNYTEKLLHLKDLECEQKVKEAQKSFGGCEKCYGKGYSTVIAPGETISSDFPDHGPVTRTVIKHPHQEVVYCTCGRGTSLKAEVERIKAEAVREERKHIDIELGRQFTSQVAFHIHKTLYPEDKVTSDEFLKNPYASLSQTEGVAKEEK